MDKTPKEIIKEALAAAANYRGSESEYHAVTRALIALEATVKQEAGHEPDSNQRSTPEQERSFTLRRLGQALTISDLLGIEQDSQASFIRRLLAGDGGAQLNADLSGIVLLPQDMVFIPPEPQAPPVTGDGESEWDDPEFRNRTEQVLLWLTNTEINGRRVFMDQLIIYRGEVDPGQMRKLPYHIIDVIPWGLQIAVCDQVGEAMFVMPKSSDEFSQLDWAAFGKTALQDHHSAIRVVMSKHWSDPLEEILTAHLQQETFTPKPKAKIDADKKNAREGRITITPHMRTTFLAHQERTGLRAIALKTAMGDQWPEGLLSETINSWFRKNDKTASGFSSNACDEKTYSTLLSFLEKQETEFRLDVIDIPCRLDRRETLAAEMERVDLGPKAVKTAMGDQWPEGLSPAILTSWFKTNDNNTSGYHVNTCDAKVYHVLLSFVEKQPDEFRLDVIDIPCRLDRRGILAAEMERSGLGTVALKTAMGDQWPEGLTSGTVKSWFESNGKTASGYNVNTCDEKIYTTLLSFLEKQETEFRLDVIDIPCRLDRRETLAAEMERTGLGAAALKIAMKLTVNEEKTRVCRSPQERFDFLGYTFGQCYSPKTGHAYMTVRSSKKSIKRMVESITHETRRCQVPMETEVMVARLNRKLNGWANYFCLGPINPAYRALNRHTVQRLRRWLCKKHKVQSNGYSRYPDQSLHERLGLVYLPARTANLLWAKA